MLAAVQLGLKSCPGLPFQVDVLLQVWFCSERDGQPLYKLVSTSSGHHSRPVYGVSWGKDAFIATACGTCQSQHVATWDSNDSR